MKMKKMIYLAFALMILSATSMNAQVAIGTENTNLEPRPGTILDLRHVTNNNMGLLLPKVTLTDAKIWAPVVGTKADEVDGMMVYNDNTSTENDLEGKGVYVWVNGSWNKIKTPPQPLTQGNPEAVSICYGSTTKFSLAAANGGSGNITYIWQQRATEDGTWEQAAGTFNQAEYTTPALTSNMHYRRTATASVSGGTIESNSAEVTVYPNFTQPNPAVANVCQGLTTTITLAPATGGSGVITYNWLQSPNGNDSWTDAIGTRNGADYTTPTNLIADTWYKRQAFSEKCGPIESNPAKVTVSPAFTQANPPANTNVCYGGTTTISLDPATGGSGTITYIWQQSADGNTNWVDADGTYNTAAYTTPALSDDMYYRRVAKCDCGTIESSYAEVTVSKTNGEPVTGKSGFTYVTYEYPTGRGIWTQNIREAGYTYDNFKGDDGIRGYYYSTQVSADPCGNLGEGWALPTVAQWQAMFQYIRNMDDWDPRKSFLICGDAMAGYYDRNYVASGYDSLAVWRAGGLGNYYTWDGTSHTGKYSSYKNYVSVRCRKNN